MSDAGSAVPPPGPAVLAAGGVVWRDGPREVEVLVVHRPRGDWSFPKGKLDPGETPPDAARREVEEETGHRCGLGPELGTVRYRDRQGRPKTVWYWAMQVLSGRPTVNEEVDDLRWCGVDEAGALLSYDTDRSVLARFVRTRSADGPSRPA